MEEALRESEEAARRRLAEIDSIYNSAPVGLCVFDDQLRYVRINEHMAKINGVPAAEHIGRTLREVLPDLADGAEALMRQILDTGEPALDIQGIGMTPAQPGVLRTWIAQWLPIKDAAERVIGVNVVAEETTERVRTDEALRKSETRWRALATTGSNVLYVMSPDWREMHLLQGGGSLADTEGPDATWLDKYIPPDDQPHVNAVIQEAIRTKSVFDLEHHVRQADGHLGWTHSRAVPILDAHGDILEWFGAARDITARRRAEEALRESEWRFRQVLENSRDIIFRLNLHTYQYDYLSPAIAELTGFTAEEFMAAGHRKMLNHVHPEERERFVGAIKASWLSPDASNNIVQYRFRHKDGAYRWLSNSWIVLKDDRSHPIALIGTTRDVNRVVEAEAAQREAEEQRAIVEAVKEERQRLLDVLETLPAMICLLTPDHRIAFANRAFREKFGMSQGRHCYERCFGQAEPCAFCEAYRVLETGQPHHWEVTLADGAIIDVYNFPFTDVDGTPMILEMNIDITEGRHAQEALVHAERMAVVGRMAATLAHEINNPLQAVVGCLGLAMEVLPENQDADRYMSVAMEELKRAARIVQRIRDLGRQSKGHRESSSLGDLIQRTIILTQERARSQGVEVLWDDNGAQLPLVPLVRDRIQQVFLNLTLNALDAMPEGGELRISAAPWAPPTAEPPGVRISFADTGEGIPPETMERLFEAFYTTKSQELGLGLGLHVSRNIIKEHGGRIDVESEVGRGTTFTVWLPTEQGE
jgi:PAS domain S-box-containing protein